MTRITAALAALLLCLSLASCSQPEPATDVRTRIVNGLDPGDSNKVLAADPETAIEELPDERIGEWAFYDLFRYGPNASASRRVIVALSDTDLVRVITATPANYQVISQLDPVEAADQAARRATSLIELTNDFSGLLYQVTSVDEIQWLQSLDADQQAAKDGFAAEFGPVIGAPSITETEGGWQVVSWWMWQDTLRQYTVEVSTDGSLDSTVDDLAGGLPTSIGR